MKKRSSILNGISHFKKKCFTVLLLFATGNYVWANSANSETTVQVETGIVLDTLNNTVALVLDEKDNPVYYTSSVFTPVCAVGECLPIRVNLFWTLAGSYMKYTLPEGEILTKVDHIHFTEEDYKKLDAVLRTQNSTLRYLLYEPGIVTENVDGITGPTARASKRDYVEGAIFTSLTLYTLIHGKAVHALKAYTRQQLISETNLLYFLDHTDGEVAELAYSWLSERRLAGELATLILERIHAKKEKHSDVAIRFLNEDAVTDSLIQPALIEIYLLPETHPSTRTYLLERWKDKQIMTVTQCGLLTGLIKYKTDFDLVLHTLHNQFFWEDEVYYTLTKAIEDENNMKRRTDLISLLESRKKEAPAEVRKCLKKIQKEMGL